MNLNKWIASDETVALAVDLLRRRSVTPDDAGCQALLGERLAAAGFRLEPMRFNDTDNLWARLGDSGPLLCFAGHTDVVPPGDLMAWSSDPFEPELRDGLLYARGAADMKTSLAAMLVAAERFLETTSAWQGSIAFLITSDEEGRARDGTLRVMQTLTARAEHIDWCVIGEPSSQKQLGDLIRIGRRGSLSGQLTVHGIQGHVAYPGLADNPITRFAPALAELCSTHWDDGNAWFPPTSFQVVNLDAGAGAVNVTPAELKARFNFRYCNDWHHEDLRDKVHGILDRHGVRYTLDWHLSGEPFLTRETELSGAVSRAIRDELGIDPEHSTGGGTSDGRFIAPAGVQVVEFGPVNASIHKIDEHIAIADAGRLTNVYERILSSLLVPA